MIINKISFGKWQVDKASLLNIGFENIVLIKKEECDIVLNGQNQALAGIKESCKVISIDNKFHLTENILTDIKSQSDLTEYLRDDKFNGIYSQREYALMYGNYKELSIQVGDLNNVGLEINSFIYTLVRKNKSGTKWKVIVSRENEDIDSFEFIGIEPYGSNLYNHYVIIFDDIENYTQRQKEVLKNQKENIGGSSMLIIK